MTFKLITASLLLTAALGAQTMDAPGATLAASVAAIPMETATPTPGAPMVFKDSNPAVTADPNFTVQGYAERWPHINLAEAKRLHARRDVVFADGRNHSEWEQSHIPGAVSLPVGEFDVRYGTAQKKLKKAHVIVAYCHGENCRLADHLAQDLVGKGHHNVAVYAGGFPGWSGAGLPLEDKDGHVVKTPTPVVQAPPAVSPTAVAKP